jgi:hypothetical protein
MRLLQPVPRRLAPHVEMSELSNASELPAPKVIPLPRDAQRAGALEHHLVMPSCSGSSSVHSAAIEREDARSRSPMLPKAAAVFGGRSETSGISEDFCDAASILWGRGGTGRPLRDRPYSLSRTVPACVRAPTSPLRLDTPFLHSRESTSHVPQTARVSAVFPPHLPLVGPAEAACTGHSRQTLGTLEPPSSGRCGHVAMIPPVQQHCDGACTRSSVRPSFGFRPHAGQRDEHSTQPGSPYIDPLEQ